MLSHSRQFLPIPLHSVAVLIINSCISFELPIRIALTKMSKEKKQSKRYGPINSTFPTRVPELYNETVSTKDPYSAEVMAEFGRPPTYFSSGAFVPPRANQFRGKFSDAQGRFYTDYPEEPAWLAVKIPNRSRASTDPLGFPEINEIITTSEGKFRILDVVLHQNRQTTAMVNVEKLT